MSNGIPVPKIATTARQDIKMLCAILDVCKKGDVSAMGVQLRLQSVSDILDGQSIDFNSMDFNENVRMRSFSRFVIALFNFLLKAHLCTTDKKLINTGLRVPMEVDYVRVTRFGDIFSHSPFAIQWIVMTVLKSLIFSFEAIKKYRWIFTVTSIVSGLFAWGKNHDITSSSIFLVLFTGFAVVIIFALITGIARVSDIDT